MLRFVFLLVLALLLVDLIYGYVMGQPTAQYIEIGLHVIAVILVLGRGHIQCTRARKFSPVHPSWFSVSSKKP